MPTSWRRRLLTPALVLAPVLGVATLPAVATSAPTPSVPAAASPAAGELDLVREAGVDPSVVVVEVPDVDELDRLVATGVDLDHGVEQHGDHMDVRAVVTPGEQAQLEAAGFTFGAVVFTPEDSADALAERAATRSRLRTANQTYARRADTNPDVSDVRIIRADYFTQFGVGYLSVEAKFADGQTNTAGLTVERDSGPGTELGSGGTQTLSRFVDEGIYLYHFGSAAVPTAGDPAAPVRPDRIRIVSPGGDTAVATVRDWLPTAGEDPFKGPGYREDFITSYLDPTELYERITDLSEEFPQLTDLVALPEKTPGYRRKSQALLEPAGNRIAVDTGADVLEYPVVSRTGGTIPANLAAAPMQTVASAPSETTPAATPEQGCGTISGLTPGAIALVTAGACTNTVKATNAQAAGASAVVVVATTQGPAAGPGNVAGTVTIPVVGISLRDGTTLRQQAGTATGRLLPATPVTDDQRVGVDSLAWGHEGGDDVSVQVVDPRAADQALRIDVAGKSVQVRPATDGTGAITTTAAQLVAALNAHPRASTLLTAYTYRGNAGAGRVVPTPLVALDDNLNAPSYVSRDPQTVYALRIGTAPEGSKPGVFAYAQEHAREWVPPLVTVEAAERLLRNYATHAPTRDLVDNLEVWIMPSVNPDGGHYSFHDFASQRKTMKNYCGPGQANDVNARTSWGVDTNRNYDTYSIFDRDASGNPYTGASTVCTNGSYAGPGELSEAEARNVDWVAGKPNMKFAMNMHSSGNYFMWSPGAYSMPGRVPAPRPTLEQESYFWEASERILASIKRHRGMTVTPARTGPIIDVLYSAAGNSGDMNWYKHGIYAWNFEVGTTFQPPFENADPNGASAHEETLEYANGLVELMRVARDLDTDASGPSSEVEITASSTPGSVNVRFLTDEASEIRYTLDGTRPTAEVGTTYQSEGLREGGELLTVPAGSKIYWYATDVAGNVERGYDPADPADTGFRKAIAEVGWTPGLVEPTVSLTVDPARVAAGTGRGRATVSVASGNDFDLPAGGEVTVTVDGRPSTATLDEDGEAVLDLGPFATAGARTVTATYGGDELTAAGSAAPRTLTVTRAPSSVRVVSQTPDRVRVSGPPGARQARLVVRPAAPGVRVTGLVVVEHGGRVIGRAPVDARGLARVTVAAFGRPGVKSVRVTYRGNESALASATTWRIRVVR